MHLQQAEQGDGELPGLGLGIDESPYQDILDAFHPKYSRRFVLGLIAANMAHVQMLISADTNPRIIAEYLLGSVD